MKAKPLQILIDALGAGDRVQARAALLLGDLRRPEAVGPLVEYVTTCRRHSKTAGFTALARIGDRGAVEAIRPLVDAPNVEDDWYWIGCKSVRAAAAVALLSMGDEGGAAYLTELADANDSVFYAWFAPAILRLGDEPPAAAALKARITPEAYSEPQKDKTRQTDPGMVAMTTEALGLIATPAAQEQLRVLLAFRSRYVRGQAALSLLAAEASDGNLAAVETIAVGDPTEFARVKAATALANVGRRQFVPFIAEVAADADDAFDQAVAVESLGLLAAEEHAETVAAQLDAADPYIRLCAVEALERIDRDRFADRVAPRADDADIHVRLQAAKYAAAGGTPS